METSDKLSISSNPVIYHPEFITLQDIAPLLIEGINEEYKVLGVESVTWLLQLG